MRCAATGLLVAVMGLPGALLIAGCGGDGGNGAPTVEESRNCLDAAGLQVSTLGEPGDEASGPTDYMHDIEVKSGSSAQLTVYESEDAAADAEADKVKFAEQAQERLENLPEGFEEEFGPAPTLDPGEIERSGKVVVEIPTDATEDEADTIRGCAGL